LVRCRTCINEQGGHLNSIIFKTNWAIFNKIEWALTLIKEKLVSYTEKKIIWVS